MCIRDRFTTETLAPNGKYEATKIIPTTASNQHYTNYGSITKASGAERQCVSFWAKLSSSNYPILKSYITGAGAFTNYSQQNFNLSTGVVASTGSGSFTNHSAKMTKYPNGWWKCEYEATLDSSETTKRLQLLANDGSSGAGNGTDGYYIWGVQVEVGNFATSHIPTSGAAATRGEDITLIDGEEFSDFYNPIESTILVDYTHIDGTTTSNIGANTRVYRFRAVGGSDTRIDYVSNTGYNPYIAKDGSNVASISDGVATVFGGGVNRTAVRVKEDSFATCLNGSTPVEDTSGAWNPTNTITEVSIGGSNGASTAQLSGHIQRFIYYPKGLPNSQLVTLTS